VTLTSRVPYTDDYVAERMRDLDEAVVYINGAYLRGSEARISPFDHGLQAGDGVFDVAGVRGGTIYRLDAHIDRLYRTARGFALEIPLMRAELRAAIIETARRNAVREGVIKYIVTRGVGEPVTHPRAVYTPPTVIIYARPWSPSLRDPSQRTLAEGGRAMFTSVRRIPPQCGLEARYKSLNYYCSIAMFLEAEAAGGPDLIPLALDINGFVAEGAHYNIFVVRKGGLLTPPPINILEGIQREAVMEIATGLGYEVREVFFTTFDVYTADEVFVVGTGGAGLRLIPLREVDGRTIGDGKPGPVMRHIERVYWEEDWPRHATPIPGLAE
jgi:branched-chain amino acid aminotransferase